MELTPEGAEWVAFHGESSPSPLRGWTDYALLRGPGKPYYHKFVITFFRRQAGGTDQAAGAPSAGMAERASSSSRKLGWAPDGTLPRPISTEIWAALPCRWATSTDWMIL